MLTRRGLIGTLLAAPAIIRTPGLLMPVKVPLADGNRLIPVEEWTAIQTFSIEFGGWIVTNPTLRLT